MSPEATEPEQTAGVKKVILEAVLVVLVGVVLAFVANALSSRGLKLTRNYFPAGTNYSVTVPVITQTPETNSTAPAAMLIVVPRLAEKGLQSIDGNQAMRFYDDSRRARDLVVFVDARGDQDYQEGHIPGAYQLDPYHPDKHLSTVGPICRAAEQIVVYCTGSDCEDSELGAILLRDAGIPNQKMFVYVAGFEEWMATNRPVEIGGRNSGNIRNANR